jgi:TatD DNase family protein
MVLCFAVHPQLPAAAGGGSGNDAPDAGLGLLETLAAEDRLDAVGETGFDLFDAAFRETEKEQERLFGAHLSLALRKDLPLVLHIRRAMHKVFACSGELKKCRAVIFHSWPGTRGEGEALLRRGINAFFSFGNAILLNHREAMRCCAVFPAERLLAETDAPYQPLRGKAFSSWADLPGILAAFSALRGKTGDMESVIEKNFRNAFGFAGMP